MGEANASGVVSLQEIRLDISITHVAPAQGSRLRFGNGVFNRIEAGVYRLLG
jgi:hypothetical protein